MRKREREREREREILRKKYRRERQTSHRGERERGRKIGDSDQLIRTQANLDVILA